MPLLFENTLFLLEGIPAGALEFELTDEDAAYLEELYVPHNIVGALSNEK